MEGGLVAVGFVTGLNESPSEKEGKFADVVTVYDAHTMPQ